jgi:hypothetical protein
MIQELKVGVESQERLVASLERLEAGLVAKGFTFVTPEASPQEMQERLAKFDEGRAWIFNKVFGFGIHGVDAPEVVKQITGRVVITFIRPGLAV